MKIGSLVILLGVVNFILLSFQVGTGLRFLKVPFTVHKRTGLILFLTALLHGALAIYAR